MRRVDFEHLIAAAADVCEEREIVVIGSQAILGSRPDAPPELLVSMEADVYPRRAPAKSDAIDGALGDGSQFHRTFGYYAHGVGPETAKAPAGWEDRLVEVRIPPRPGREESLVALCLELHDLVLSKAVASRDRDWDYVEIALREGLVDHDVLLARVDDLPVAESSRRRVRSMLRGIQRKLGGE